MEADGECQTLECSVPRTRVSASYIDELFGGSLGALCAFFQLVLYSHIVHTVTGSTEHITRLESKVLLSAAFCSGALSTVLSTPILCAPLTSSSLQIVTLIHTPSSHNLQTSLSLGTLVCGCVLIALAALTPFTRLTWLIHRVFKPCVMRSAALGVGLLLVFRGFDMVSMPALPLTQTHGSHGDPRVLLAVPQKSKLLLTDLDVMLYLFCMLVSAYMYGSRRRGKLSLPTLLALVLSAAIGSMRSHISQAADLHTNRNQIFNSESSANAQPAMFDAGNVPNLYTTALEVAAVVVFVMMELVLAFEVLVRVSEQPVAEAVNEDQHEKQNDRERGLTFFLVGLCQVVFGFWLGVGCMGILPEMLTIRAAGARTRTAGLIASFLLLLGAGAFQILDYYRHAPVVRALELPMGASAPPLTVAAVLQLRAVSDTAWKDVVQAVPAMICLLSVPLSRSIASGAVIAAIVNASLRLTSHISSLGEQD